MDSQTFKARSLLALAAVAVMLLAFAGSASATTTWNVNTTDNHFDGTCDSDCTLRDAVNEANNDDDDSVVNVPAGTYDTPGVVLFVDGSIGTFTLNGAGARSTVIDAQRTPEDFGLPVFEIGPDEPATISGVTVTGGNNSGIIVEDIASQLADLTVRDSTLANNFTDEEGGGILNCGHLTVERTTFSGNQSNLNGSAIGTLTDSCYTIDAPSTRGSLPGADTTVINSTFNDNTSDADRGGSGDGALWAEGNVQQHATLDIVNSTISGNASANGFFEANGTPAGGISVGEEADVTVVNSIVTDNTGDPVNPLTSPRVSGPQPQNCNVSEDGTLTSLGHNIETATDCGFTAAGDQQNVADPKLGPLANNGGQMDTMALLSGSPAIDKADAAACPDTDEIGTVRPQGPACDVGAFELPVAGTPTQPGPGPGPSPQPSPKPAAPKVGVAGVRRACVSKSFHVRFHVATAAGVKSVTVKLDGKKIKSTTKSSFTLAIKSRKLKAGRHRLTISAVDSAGQTTTTRKTFSVCKTVKPRRRVAPRFTG